MRKFQKAILPNKVYKNNNYQKSTYGGISKYLYFFNHYLLDLNVNEKYNEHIFKLKKKLGKLFISCDLPNTDSLTLSIFAGIAQRERELISIKTKAALKVKKKRGAKLSKSKNFSDKGRQLGSQKTAERAKKNIT